MPRNGEYAAHAAGVGALVVVEGAFVVLAGFERDDRAAVGQGQHAGLLAVEPLLDDQAVAGLAEDAANHDLIDALDRLAEVVADVDTFAGGQSVGLQDQAQGASQHEVASLGGRIEYALLPALFNFDLNAGAHHLARVHDPVDRLERFAGRAAMQRMPDRRAAARADNQSDLARQDVMLGVGARAKDPVVGRRNARLPHQLLGEELAPF